MGGDVVGPWCHGLLGYRHLKTQLPLSPCGWIPQQQGKETRCSWKEAEKLHGVLLTWHWVFLKSSFLPPSALSYSALGSNESGQASESNIQAGLNCASLLGSVKAAWRRKWSTTQENSFKFEKCPPSLVGRLFFIKIGTTFFSPMVWLLGKW